MLSYGLIAGVTVTEARRCPPGLLIDLYVMRQRYDDQQHGIKRISRKEELEKL